MDTNNIKSVSFPQQSSTASKLLLFARQASPPDPINQVSPYLCSRLTRNVSILLSPHKLLDTGVSTPIFAISSSPSGDSLSYTSPPTTDSKFTSITPVSQSAFLFTTSISYNCKSCDMLHVTLDDAKKKEERLNTMTMKKNRVKEKRGQGFVL